jgi:formate dehydrogenase major subunit
VSMLHMLHAKENGCKMIVVDPRFTRTAAKADEYVRIRSGTDIPFLFGVLHHIFKNGWEDKQYINDRVYGMEGASEDVMAKWTPDKVEEACGVPKRRCSRWPRCWPKPSPGTIVWCMGQTQHTIGNAMVRASCILQLALGNIGKSGGGTNIFRGHDNVQGATDVGPNPDSLPGYYGWPPVPGSTSRHGLGRGLRLDQGPVRRRHDGKARHHRLALDRRRAGKQRADRPGPEPARRVLLGPCAQLADPRSGNEAGHGQAGPAGGDRPVPVGHGLHGGDARQARGPQPQARGVPAAGRHAVRDQRFLHRLQPLAPVARKVIEPLWESRSDHMIMYQFAQKAGLREELCKNYKMEKVKGMDEPVVEDILREINKAPGPSATPARARSA